MQVNQLKKRSVSFVVLYLVTVTEEENSMLLFYHFLIFYFGCSWGSFLMATYQRRLTGDSITFPASHCDYCLTPLPYFCLFPIFSYCFSKGRCLFCGNQIPLKMLGQGDLEVMVFLALLFGTSVTSGIICLACLIALVRIMVSKQRMVAFVPCLFAANWLVLTYINHSAPQLIMLR